FFFFQAEDGIRDRNVTGVQTCALPIYSLKRIFRYTSAIVSACAFLYISMEGIFLRMNEPSFILLLAYILIALNFAVLTNLTKREIGRASCREARYTWEVGDSF